MERKIILIGGAPTAGKTSLAIELAKNLNMPWISTDMIREFMRTMLPKEEYPALFHFPNSDALEYLSSHTAEEIVADLNNESRVVWKGVKNFIDAVGKTWEENYIIEGIAILPELIHENFKDEKAVKTFFIIDNDEERIRKAIFERGLWDDANEYPDSVKEKEVQWVLEFNKYIKKEIKKYPFPIIEVKNRESLAHEIMEILKK